MAVVATSCPLNVTFFACDFGERFLGCCENGSPADTCTNGCPQEDLLPASFDKAYYDYITQAACTSGDWWSCANTSPPFLGCCSSNPCLDGCPPGNLTAAIFSQNQTANPLYTAISDPATTASSTTLPSIPTVASSNSVHTTGTAHSATTSPSPVHENSTRKLVGGLVGGIIAVGGIVFGVLLLYSRLKLQGYKGSDSRGNNRNKSNKDIGPRNPTVSDTSRQENDASDEVSTISNPRRESKVPIPRSQSLRSAPDIEKRMPLEINASTSGDPQEDHEENKTSQELPPNHAPLPEIASSDPPPACHELASSDRHIQKHVHPRVLQPGRSGFRPCSASSLSQAPQPYGLGFRPHSPSQLSMVSYVGTSPSLARGLSPVSITNDDISADA